MPQLVVRHHFYLETLLEKWKDGDVKMLSESTASHCLKEILSGKVARRKKRTRRFFGEAYVATRIQHKHGYYGSFRWLTNPLFVNKRNFRDGAMKGFQEQYREALLRCFGKAQLERLQQKARAFRKATGIRPVPPDLWLIDRHGRHRFIEVKLPGDQIRPSQQAGMRLIASSLRASTGVSVEIIELTPDKERATTG